MKSVLMFMAALVLAGPAAAHAFLAEARPAVGGTVAGPVREIRLAFTEAVEPDLSAIALATAAGADIALSELAADPADARVLVAGVPEALAPGLYRVTWRVVSVDTHRTQGDFTFTVAP